MKRAATTAFAALLACLAPARASAPAQASKTEPLDIGAALELGLERSPALKAQRTLTTMAGRDRWRRWLLNEPQATFASADDGSTETYGLQLALPFPGKTIAFSELDAAKARAQDGELGARKNDVARSVAQAFIDCATGRALSEVHQSTALDLEALSRSIGTLYESGHSTQAEKIGSELQFRQARADLAESEDKSRAACRKLADVLYMEAPPETAPLPDDLDDARLADLGALTPDEARAKGSLEVARASASVAYWTQAPDFTVSAARNHYLYSPASPAGKDWTTTFGVGVTIPIFFLFHENSEAQRAKAQANLDRSVAELQLRAAEADKDDAAREWRRTRARLREIHEKDLALSQALVDSTMAAYRLGKLGFAEVLFSRKTLADLRTQEAQLKGATIMARLRCMDACAGAAAPKGLK